MSVLEDHNIDPRLFPLVFSVETDVRTVNRLADIWEAVGLQTKITQRGSEYVLTLHAPKADK